MHKFFMWMTKGRFGFLDLLGFSIVWRLWDSSLPQFDVVMWTAAVAIFFLGGGGYGKWLQKQKEAPND